MALQRLGEVVYSKSNQRQLGKLGAQRVADTAFPWMIATHTFILLGSAVEVIYFDPPLIPLLTWTSGFLFIASNLVRFWVIVTLRDHWNVNVVNSAGLGVVANGPYRWVRHPNYSAVFVEMLALPLIHTAVISAAIGAILHIVAIRKRVSVEDGILMASSEYRRALGEKPKFIPRLFA